MTRAYNTATTQQNSGGAINPFIAGKNKIINGDFGIWQRGTSFNATSGVFTADRWLSYQDAGTGTTTQQTFTPGTAPVAGYEGTYFIRSAKTSTASGTHVPVYQRIEDARLFAGQTATISFWAKADTTTVVTPAIYRNYGTGGSTTESFSASTITLTSSWARYSATFTIPSISGKTVGTNSCLEVQPIRITDSLTHTFDVWGVQFEAGPVATPFQTATGTIQGELAACQRYYYQWTAANAYSPFGVGFTQGTTLAILYKAMPVVMRTTPTLTTTGTAANYAVMNGNTGRIACSAVPVINQGNPDGLIVDWAATGLTAGGAIEGNANNTTAAYVGFSAEL
jgi:hypothetical protein